MLAIHYNEIGFSQKWIEYCEENKIEYKLVDSYADNIVEELRGCEAFFWHWNHNSPKDILFARQLIYSCEAMNIKVFPDSKTVWHFDDKVGQKYLLESIQAPLVNSYVFYSEKEALNWARSTDYPKVFKLRGGSGSRNVFKIDSFKRSKNIIKKSFSSGFNKSARVGAFKNYLWYFLRDRDVKSFFNIYKGVARIFFPSRESRLLPKEIGYVYAQDFIPDNDSDIRIIVIGRRAFAIKRMVRTGDFKASGSGLIYYDRKLFPLECVNIAFETTHKLSAQCVAYDFVFLNGKPKIVEISYAFNRLGYLDCPGYWDVNLNWHNGRFFPEYFMIEDVIKSNVND